MSRREVWVLENEGAPELAGPVKAGVVGMLSRFAEGCVVVRYVPAEPESGQKQADPPVKPDPTAPKGDELGELMMEWEIDEGRWQDRKRFDNLFAMVRLLASRIDGMVPRAELQTALRRAAHSQALGTDGQNALHFTAQELEQAK